MKFFITIFFVLLAANLNAMDIYSVGISKSLSVKIKNIKVDDVFFKISQFETDTQLLRKFSSGALDIAIFPTSYGLKAIVMKESVDLVGIGRKNYLYLLIPKKSKIKDLKDLTGKVIYAVPTIGSREFLKNQVADNKILPANSLEIQKILKNHFNDTQADAVIVESDMYEFYKLNKNFRSIRIDAGSYMLLSSCDDLNGEKSAKVKKAIADIGLGWDDFSAKDVDLMLRVNEEIGESYKVKRKLEIFKNNLLRK